MFDNRPHLIAVRSLLASVLMMFFAGCGPGSISPVVPVDSAPGNVVATAGDGSVALSWSGSSDATSSNVKRSTTKGGPYTQLASPTATTYTDSTVTNGTTYYYVVTAVNASGESANSAEVSAIPQKAGLPPVPTNLVATAGNAQVGLSWTASTSATSYNVKRATVSGGPYTVISNPAPTNPAYTDTTAANGTKYFYVVSAVGTGGESGNSTEVNATPSATPTFGVWTDVTPSNANKNGTLGCGNFGTQNVQADPGHAGNLYVQFNCQGIWKSTDYGATWTGPINTGTNGTTISDCAGGITIPPNSSSSSPPTIFQACIRGNATGFARSTDGGVNWTRYTITPTTRQDYFPPVVDPYDANHLLMTGHEFNSIVESVDGGQHWTAVNMAANMLQNGATGLMFFINTGTASTTRTTWLWLGQGSGGAIGTWRSTDSGTTWTQVDKNEHPGSSTQIYQPDNNGVVFMAGVFSALGAGVLRSTDYGQTWTHVGQNVNQESVVYGTSKNVYGMYGFPEATDLGFQIAPVPGTGTWTLQTTPANLFGPAEVAVVNDGTHNITVGAMWTSGVWRYVEP